jgi:hypothetical protein
MINDDRIKEFKNASLQSALSFSYDRLSNYLDELSLYDPQNNFCEGLKVKSVSMINSVIKGGVGLFAASGPPLTSLGAMLAAKPLTNFLGGLVSGAQDTRQLQEALNKTNLKRDLAFKDYGCMLYSAQALKCDLNKEVQLVCLSTKKDEAARKSLASVVDDLKTSLAASRSKDSLPDQQADNTTALYTSLFDSKFEYNGAKDKTFRDILTSWKSNLTDSPSSSTSGSGFGNVRKSEIRTQSRAETKTKLDEAITKIDLFRKAYEGYRTKSDLPALLEAQKGASDALEKDVASALTAYLQVSPAESNIYGYVAARLNDEIEEKQAPKIQLTDGQRRDRRETLKAIFDSLGSKYFQRLANERFEHLENAWKDLQGRKVVIYDDLFPIFQDCLMAFQWGVSNGRFTKEYERACGFLKKCSSSGTVPFDLNGELKVDPQSSDPADFAIACRVRSRQKRILDNLKADLAKDQICGMPARTFLGK